MLEHDTKTMQRVALGGIRERAQKHEPLAIQHTVLMVGLAASALTIGATLGSAVGVMAGTAGGLTLTSWLALVTTRRDRMAFYQQAGVNVTRAGRINV